MWMLQVSSDNKLGETKPWDNSTLLDSELNDGSPLIKCIRPSFLQTVNITLSRKRANITLCDKKCDLGMLVY